MLSIKMAICIGPKMSLSVICCLLHFNNNHPITEKDWNIIVIHPKPKLTYICILWGKN